MNSLYLDGTKVYLKVYNLLEINFQDSFLLDFFNLPRDNII